MSRQRKSEPAQFAADAAEAKAPAPCAICGTLTLRSPAKGGTLATCSAEHGRILKEAEAGTSPSTVMLHDVTGGPGRLMFRAYSAQGTRGAVRMQVIEALPGLVNTKTGSLTPSEARRLAGALIRAANRAEDKPASGEIARA